MKTFEVSALFIFGAAIAVGIEGQIPHPATMQVQKVLSQGISGHAASIPKLCFDDKAFSDSQPALPISFCGVDVKGLFDAIDKSTFLAPKSEFETTSAYESRLSAFPINAIVPGLMPSDNLAFVLKQSDGDSPSASMSATYDADTQEFAIKFDFHKRQLLLLPDQPKMEVIELRTDILKSSDYIATNAMGATMQVHETDSTTYGIAMKPDNWIFSQARDFNADGLSEPTFYLKVKREEAASMKPNLQAVLVARLIAPWSANDVVSHDPTFDEPHKLIDEQNLLMVEGKTMLLYRKDTGEILSSTYVGSFDKANSPPLNLALTCYSPVTLDIEVDGKSSTRTCQSETGMIRATNAIKVKTSDATAPWELTFMLNGQKFSPNWVSNEKKIGKKSFFNSASFTVTAP